MGKRRTSSEFYRDPQSQLRDPGWIYQISPDEAPLEPCGPEHLQHIRDPFEVLEAGIEDIRRWRQRFPDLQSTSGLEDGAAVPPAPRENVRSVNGSRARRAASGSPPNGAPHPPPLEASTHPRRRQPSTSPLPLPTHPPKSKLKTIQRSLPQHHRQHPVTLGLTPVTPGFVTPGVANPAFAATPSPTLPLANPFHIPRVHLNRSPDHLSAFELVSLKPTVWPAPNGHYDHTTLSHPAPSLSDGSRRGVLRGGADVSSPARRSRGAVSAPCICDDCCGASGDSWDISPGSSVLGDLGKGDGLRTMGKARTPCRDSTLTVSTFTREQRRQVLIQGIFLVLGLVLLGGLAGGIYVAVKYADNEGPIEIDNVSFQGNLSLNQEFNDTYRDHNSPEFNKFTLLFITEMNAIYEVGKFREYYNGTAVNNLASGSIIVDFTVDFKVAKPKRRAPCPDQCATPATEDEDFVTVDSVMKNLKEGIAASKAKNNSLLSHADASSLVLVKSSEKFSTPSPSTTTSTTLPTTPPPSTTTPEPPATTFAPDMFMEPSSECTIFFQKGRLTLDCGHPDGAVPGVAYVIAIDRAFYGWGNQHYNCHYADGDCYVETTPKPVNTSLTSCDGVDFCVLEIEQSKNNKRCDTYGFHDYIQIEYRCVPKNLYEFRLRSTVAPPTVDPTTPPSPTNTAVDPHFWSALVAMTAVPTKDGATSLAPRSGNSSLSLPLFLDYHNQSNHHEGNVTKLTKNTQRFLPSSDSVMPSDMPSDEPSDMSSDVPSDVLSITPISPPQYVPGSLVAPLQSRNTKESLINVPQSGSRRHGAGHHGVTGDGTERDDPGGNGTRAGGLGENGTRGDGPLETSRRKNRKHRKKNLRNRELVTSPESLGENRRTSGNVERRQRQRMRLRKRKKMADKTKDKFAVRSKRDKTHRGSTPRNWRMTNKRQAILKNVILPSRNLRHQPGMTRPRLAPPLSPPGPNHVRKPPPSLPEKIPPLEWYARASWPHPLHAMELKSQRDKKLFPDN